MKLITIAGARQSPHRTTPCCAIVRLRSTSIGGRQLATECVGDAPTTKVCCSAVETARPPGKQHHFREQSRQPSFTVSQHFLNSQNHISRTEDGSNSFQRTNTHQRPAKWTLAAAGLDQSNTPQPRDDSPPKTGPLQCQRLRCPKVVRVGS